jgi:hypothetical protein
MGSERTGEGEGKGAGASKRRADLLFLPSYSPELNPVEEAFTFSKIKALVRTLVRSKEGARMREALVEAIRRALVAVRPEDAVGWFGHAGYWPQDQSLRVPFSEVSFLRGPHAVL